MGKSAEREGGPKVEAGDAAAAAAASAADRLIAESMGLLSSWKDITTTSTDKRSAALSTTEEEKVLTGDGGAKSADKSIPTIDKESSKNGENKPGQAGSANEKEELIIPPL